MLYSREMSTVQTWSCHALTYSQALSPQSSVKSLSIYRMVGTESASKGCCGLGGGSGGESTTQNQVYQATLTPDGK